MSFTKLLWKNKLVEKPKTYNFQANADLSITLIPAEGVVTEAGTPINAANMNRLEDGIAEVNDYIRSPAWGASGGAVNAYTFSAMAATSYVDGMSVYLDNITAANTGAATLNWSGLGVRSIKDGKGAALTAGKMPLNCIIGLRYNASTASFQLLGEGGDTLTGNFVAADLLLGKTGYSTNAQTKITGTKDLSNLIAANIKKDINIAGVIGTFNKTYGVGDSIAYTALGFTYPPANKLATRTTNASSAGIDSLGNAYFFVQGEGMLYKYAPDGTLTTKMLNTSVSRMEVINDFIYYTVWVNASTGGVTKLRCSDLGSVWSISMSEGMQAITKQGSYVYVVGYYLIYKLNDSDGSNVSTFSIWSTYSMVGANSSEMSIDATGIIFYSAMATNGTGRQIRNVNSATMTAGTFGVITNCLICQVDANYVYAENFAYNKTTQAQYLYYNITPNDLVVTPNEIVMAHNYGRRKYSVSGATLTQVYDDMSAAGDYPSMAWDATRKRMTIMSRAGVYTFQELITINQ